MAVTIGDIRQQWDIVRPALEKIKENFDWLDWRPEDVYASCVNGQSILYISEEGFTIFRVATNNLSGENTFFCWIAFKWQGDDLIKTHMDFFESEARKYNCQRIGAGTPIEGLETLFTSIGWRCDTREFSKALT